MLRILGRTTSINVRKVLWTAVELGLTFTHEDQWGTPPASLKTPEFLKLNPNGLVPVIEDDEAGVLWESHAICRYLAAKHARGDLLPARPAERAHVEMWMDWVQTELNSAWSYAFMALVRKDAGYADPARIHASAEAWNGQMRLLNHQLAQTNAYVAGSTFSVADVVVGLALHRWQSTPIERPSLPAVERYRERLVTRAGFRRYCKPELP